MVAATESQRDSLSIPVDHGPSTTSGDMQALEIAEETQARDETDIQLEGAQFILLIVALALSLVLVGLDSTILATAMPSITSDFKTIADIAWYSSAYRLTSCSFQFMFGKVYSLYSVKRIFLVVVAIFEIGSLLAATAPTSQAFIVGRAVCGIGQAGIYAGCFTLVRLAIPLRRRSIFASIGSAVEGLSEISAPLLGGFITDALNWRWCFYINLPLGAFTMVVVTFCLPDYTSARQLSWKQKLSQIDMIGTLVLIPAVSCLLLSLQWAGFKYGWANPRIIVLLILFAALLLVFGWHQHRRQDAAVLPPRIMKQRTILSGMWFTFCNNGSQTVISYYMPIYFQSVRGSTASKSGILTLPSIIGFIITVLGSGFLTSLLGYYTPFAIATGILFPIASGLMTTLTIHTPLKSLIGYQFFLGAACGLGFQSPQVAVQTTLPAKDASVGISVILFAQALGPAIFVSAAQNLFLSRLTRNLQHYVPGVNTTMVEDIGLSDIKKHIHEKGKLHGVLESYDRSLMETFMLPVVLTCLTLVGALGMEWRSVKVKRS